MNSTIFNDESKKGNNIDVLIKITSLDVIIAT